MFPASLYNLQKNKKNKAPNKIKKTSEGKKRSNPVVPWCT